MVKDRLPEDDRLAEISLAQEQAFALMQMFQAGYKAGRGGKWEDIKEGCAKAFKKQFGKGIDRGIKENAKKHKKDSNRYE